MIITSAQSMASQVRNRGNPMTCATSEYTQSHSLLFCTSSTSPTFSSPLAGFRVIKGMNFSLGFIFARRTNSRRVDKAPSNKVITSFSLIKPSAARLKDSNSGRADRTAGGSSLNGRLDGSSAAATTRI